MVLRRRAAGETLREIGEDMGLSRERVRQVETEAIGKVQKASNGRQANGLALSRHD